MYEQRIIKLQIGAVLLWPIRWWSWSMKTKRNEKNRCGNATVWVPSSTVTSTMTMTTTIRSSRHLMATIVHVRHACKATRNYYQLNGQYLCGRHTRSCRAVATNDVDNVQWSIDVHLRFNRKIHDYHLQMHCRLSHFSVWHFIFQTHREIKLFGCGYGVIGGGHRHFHESYM